MHERKRSPLLETALCCLLPLASGLPAQTPGQPGRMVITSTPKGATIVVNGKKMGQTDASFAVSPGNYTVSVSGGSGNLSCPEKSVKLAAGSTIELSCTSAGWAGKK
jgi:hypothetical protein